MYTWLSKYRTDGFDSALIDAKKLLLNWTLSQFSKTRIHKQKRKFANECVDGPKVNPQENFCLNCFNVILDKAIISMNYRYEQLKSHNEVYGFDIWSSQLMET